MKKVFKWLVGLMLIALLIWGYNTIFWAIADRVRSYDKGFVCLQNIEEWAEVIVVAGVDRNGNAWDLGLMEEMSVEVVGYKPIKIWRKRKEVK